MSLSVLDDIERLRVGWRRSGGILWLPPSPHPAEPRIRQRVFRVVHGEVPDHDAYDMRPW